MRHLGGRNGFPMEGVRALPRTGLVPGAAERKPDGHLLLGAAWEELGLTDLEVKDSDLLPAMPETAGDRWR